MSDKSVVIFAQMVFIIISSSSSLSFSSTSPSSSSSSVPPTVDSSLSESSPSVVTGKLSRCERITIPMCKDMPYNYTRMPNILGHHKQADAAIKVHEFIPLVEIGCSKNLKLFLCSLYAPMCSEQIDVPIPSCQSICEEVKSRCMHVLRQYNFDWPPMLNCSRLPTSETGICMELPSHRNQDQRKSNKTSTEGSAATLPVSTFTPDTKPKQILKLSPHPNSIPELSQDEKDNSTGLVNTIKTLNGDRNSGSSAGKRDEIGFKFGSKYPSSFLPAASNNGSPGVSNYGNPQAIPIDIFTRTDHWSSLSCPMDFVYIPVTHKDPNCSHICVQECGKDVLFTTSDKSILSITMTTLASICFFSTLFTTFTFWLDPVEFPYPERSIAFLSICHCLSSVAYLIRAYAGPEFISCDQTDFGKFHLAVEGLENSGCIIVFILLYYFGMAALIWWLLLTITWYLLCFKNWTPESIESKASILHFFAWAVPAILTANVLTMRQVDGDELTGLCFVGYQEPKALLSFVIIPVASILTIGILILFKGYLTSVLNRSLCLIKINPFSPGGLIVDIGNNNERRQVNTKNGIFSVIYAIPLICVLFCQLYEYLNLERWHLLSKQRALQCQATNLEEFCDLTESIPRKEAFLLKLIMSLVLGILSAICSWNSKTRHIWFSLGHSVCGRPRKTRRRQSGLQQRHYNQHLEQLLRQQSGRSLKAAAPSTAIHQTHESSYVQMPSGVGGSPSGGTGAGLITSSSHNRPSSDSGASCASGPHIQRIFQHLYPYASIKSHRSARNYHVHQSSGSGSGTTTRTGFVPRFKHANEITQL